MDRIWSGLKPASEFKSLGQRSTTSIRFNEGAPQGATGYPVANPCGRELLVRAHPQIGFEQAPQPVVWCRIEDVPDREFIASIGIDVARPWTILTRELSTERANELLRIKGFGVSHSAQVLQPPVDKTIETTTVGIIGTPEKRAATKIALNYIAKICGPSIALAYQFDDVRKFARYGVGQSRVHVSENPWTFRRASEAPLRGHYLAAQTEPSGRIVAQVSLFLRIRYIVHMMSRPFATGTFYVSSAHFFDIDARQASSIQVPPLVQGKTRSTNLTANG